MVVQETKDLSGKGKTLTVVEDEKYNAGGVILSVFEKGTKTLSPLDVGERIVSVTLSASQRRELKKLL